MTHHGPHHVHHRVGGWLPKDQRVVESWIQKQLDKLPTEHDVEGWHPVIREFKNLIEDDPDIWMGFHQMFEQVPTKPPYNQDPTKKPQIRDYMTMLAMFNHILNRAPDYEDDDLVGFPFNAILDWPMGTPGGFTAFINPKVNIMFKKMFDVWAAFLSSKASCSVLSSDDDGWFGPKAQKAIPDFDHTFICDPNAPYHGFTSWDDFFTRKFRPGKRPVPFASNNAIIHSACESAVYKIARGIKARDTFWLKGEPYSLEHMLNHDPSTEHFVGGSIWQAFLSALSYHRWASPVNGTVVKTVNIPGTYYAESPAMGFSNPDGPDDSGPNLSQAFITSLAARALIFIEADSPAIGLMCFVAVGMAEVSTCEITVKEGQKVSKGQETGMFHFGGSTHCLLFRRGVEINFNPDYKLQDKVKLNAPIAMVGQWLLPDEN